MAVVTELVVPSAMETELARLHRAHYRSLVRLASLLVDDLGVCEELVQDAFVAVLGRRGALRDPGKLPAYLRSAVLNGARTQLRRGRVRERRPGLRVVGEAPAADIGAVEADDRRAVLGALRSLPDRQREVLLLRYYLDLSEPEIAATLGIAPGTVKTHVQRGMAQLARLLEDRR
ncbi:MAG: SigE family RNA polymerase sigma factor [Acidimicrobiales bacterium]